MGMLERLLCQPLNHLLVQSEWAVLRLRPFSGARVRMGVGTLFVHLCITETGTFEACDPAEMPDVSITLPSDTVLRAVTDRQSIFQAAKLSGSADLAEALGFVFRHLRWDMEADLARVLGDIPARRLTLLQQSLQAQGSAALRRVADNASEYLIEEAGMLATRTEIEAFNDGVSALRDDLARLEKRLQRL